MLDARWQNYLLWLQERGLRLPTGMCKHCGYLPVAKASLTICYPNSLSAQEKNLLQEQGDILNKAVHLPLLRCRNDQFCTQQRRDLQRRTHVLLLGAASSKMLFDVQPRFARERGNYRQHADWGETRFMLTFHPRDILRYPANQLDWQKDFAEAIDALSNS